MWSVVLSILPCGGHKGRRDTQVFCNSLDPSHFHGVCSSCHFCTCYFLGSWFHPRVWGLSRAQWRAFVFWFSAAWIRNSVFVSFVASVVEAARLIASATDADSPHTSFLILHRKKTTPKTQRNIRQEPRLQASRVRKVVRLGETKMLQKHGKLQNSGKLVLWQDLWSQKQHTTHWLPVPSSPRRTGDR